MRSRKPGQPGQPGSYEEALTAVGLRCRQNLKFEHFTSLFSRLRQNIAAKSVPYVQHDFFPYATSEMVRGVVVAVAVS